MPRHHGFYGLNNGRLVLGRRREAVAADTTGPIISNPLITDGVLTFSLDEASNALYGVYENDADVELGTYVQATALAGTAPGEIVNETLTNGQNSIVIDESGITPGTYTLKLAARDVYGNLSANSVNIPRTVYLASAYSSNERVSPTVTNKVVNIPAAGQYLIVAFSYKLNSGTSFSASGSTGITATFRNGLGDYSAAIGSDRVRIAWVEVDATQSGTVTLAWSASVDFQHVVVFTANDVSLPSRAGNSNQTANPLVALTALNPSSRGFFAVITKGTADYASTPGGSLIPSDEKLEILRSATSPLSDFQISVGVTERILSDDVTGSFTIAAGAAYSVASFIAFGAR